MQLDIASGSGDETMRASNAWPHGTPHRQRPAHMLHSAHRQTHSNTYELKAVPEKMSTEVMSGARLLFPANHVLVCTTQKK